ncbi:MAG: glycoside hydrolase family 127 protein [Candidatus Hydrogenedentes bacterium]|nr:glycoside hydrolase family 127 protein [Candidatus Hydrogenedentota bacterium]
MGKLLGLALLMVALGLWPRRAGGLELHVERAYHALVNSPDLVIFGGVAGYFGGKGNRDEGCSEADFLRLSLQLWHATRNAQYLEFAERCLFNHFFGNQFRTGDFGHHLLCREGFAPLLGTGRAWWYCTMHGLRAFRDVLDSMVTCDEHGMKVELFLDGECRAGDFHARMEGHTIESGLMYEIRVENAPLSEFSISLRVPPWASEVNARINGCVEPLHIREGYQTASRRWEKGDILSVDFALATRLMGRDGESIELGSMGREPIEAALWCGPWLLGVHEAKNPLFFGEPWQENVVVLPAALRFSKDRGSEPLDTPLGKVKLPYLHGGFPDSGVVVLQPVSARTQYEQSAAAVWLHYCRGE